LDRGEPYRAIRRETTEKYQKVSLRSKKKVVRSKGFKWAINSNWGHAKNSASIRKTITVGFRVQWEGYLLKKWHLKGMRTGSGKPRDIWEEGGGLLTQE